MSDRMDGRPRSTRWPWSARRRPPFFPMGTQHGTGESPAATPATPLSTADAVALLVPSTAIPVPDDWFADHVENVMRELIVERNRRRDETVADFLRECTPHEWGRVRVLEYDGPPVFGGPSGVIFELWLGPRVTPVEDMTLHELGQWFARTLAVRRELGTR